MASPAVDISHGMTLVASGNAFAPQVTDITPPAISVEDVQTTHQSTTTAHTYKPTDVKENGELSMEIHFNPDTNPPVGTVLNWTLTFPTATTGGAATWAWSGYIKNYEPDAPHLDKMTGTVVIKVSGDITITAAT